MHILDGPKPASLTLAASEITVVKKAREAASLTHLERIVGSCSLQNIRSKN